LTCDGLKFRQIPDQYTVALGLHESLTLESCQYPINRTFTQAEIFTDATTAQAEVDVVLCPTQAFQAGTKTYEQCGYSSISHRFTQNRHDFVVQTNLFTHDLDESLAQACDLIGEPQKLFKRKSTYAGWFQRQRSALIQTRTYPRHTDELAWKINAGDLFRVIELRRDGTLQRSGTNNVDGTKTVAPVVQMLAGFERGGPGNDLLKQAQLSLFQLGRQTKPLEMAMITD
jgi:hypothetical protein